ncbi:helix-turn-helix domain-containing protein (plasmid) [Halorutilales archaeon Cl-col2-1]
MPAQIEEPPDEVHSLDRVTVLLIDDDETWARVTGRLLSNNTDALDVTTAHSLKEGRELFERLDPDCVVCDYQLGDGTGISLLEEVRETDPDRPFLLVTGRGDEGVASESIGKGVTDYIRKDEDDDEASLLASRIKSSVRSYRTERALERERRSKTALLDILTGTTAQKDLSQEFCTRLVNERDYACAWIARETTTGLSVPQAVAGRESYFDAIHSPNQPLPEGEPAREALETDDAVLTRLDEPVSDTGTEWEPLAHEYGFEGAVAVPIRYDGIRFGVLAAYADDVSLLDDVERTTVEEYAETVGYALTNAERKRSLASSRPVSVRIDISTDAVPLRGLTDSIPTDATVDVLSTVLRDDGTTLYVATIDGDCRQDIADEISDADGVQSVNLDRSVSPHRCEIVVTSPTPESILTTHGIAVKETTLSGDTMKLSLTLPDDEAVSKIQNVLETKFDDASVSTVWTHRESDGSTTDQEFVSAMTDRQREVLRHALDVGYFERPRGTSATELADHFGLSRATVSQHLRSAQRKIFTGLFYGQTD